MDVHRCRFVPYPPSPINALTFSHAHIFQGQETAPPRLAVGRANGDIEIWNPLKGSWLQETIIRGGKDRSIDGLVWIQDPNEEIQGKTIIGKSRLFSIGYTSTVTEWDLEKGRPLRQASGNHGEIWCIAAQPPMQQTKNGDTGASTGQWRGQNLIAGCTDGALVLYSTKDDGLELQKVLVRPSSKKAKVISVAFQDRNIVIAGCSDSTIRVFDIRNGQTLRTMSLGSALKGGPKEIIVWSVKVLKNGDIFSGDSTGELKIWDGKTYTLTQRIKSHRNDVLSLAASNDGTTIFSGGMDRKTVIYKAVGKGKVRWEEVRHHRFHDHDVKTMTSFEGHGVSVVVSGGPDASPKVLPLQQYGFENSRSLPFLPQEKSTRSSPQQKLVMSWWDRELHIWQLSKQSLAGDGEEEPTTRDPKLVAKILVQGDSNITSAALNSSGSLVAVSTSADIKFFQLRPRTGDIHGLKVSKIDIPKSLSFGARLLQFSPDGNWLCVIRMDSRIGLARITSSAASASPIVVHSMVSTLSRLNRHVEKFVSLGGLGTYDRTITQAEFSSDSRILAVSDLAGYIDTFILEGQEDFTEALSNDEQSATLLYDSDSGSDLENEKEPQTQLIFSQHWRRNPSASLLPKLPATPVVLSFRPTSSLKQKAFTNGAVPHPTRNNPHPISHDMPVGEDRLMVLTAATDIFEFEVLKGGLSAWSRRNPSTAFPEKFKRIRDQSRGAFWDVSGGKERVWIYGVGWLWMFDLSRDLPPVAPEETPVNGQINGGETAEQTSNSSNKRKRRNKQGTGAGSHIPDSELGMGISRSITTGVYEEPHVDHSLVPPSADAMDIDEDEVESASRLQRSRSDDDKQVVNGDAEAAAPYWYTFKYRPILGICLIGEGDADDGVEVAVIERPIWETDLPPRYHGDQEWEKMDL